MKYKYFCYLLRLSYMISEDFFFFKMSDYPSHNEADAALIPILAFYCGGDMAQMNRLFRKSGLYHHKWDEFRGSDTCGNITIKNVVAKCKAFYKPLWNLSAEDGF